METPLSNIETAIANIEEILEDLTLPYSAALHINDNLNTLRQALRALEYIQSSKADNKITVDYEELTEQEKQVGDLFPYLKRTERLSMSFQDGLVYEYLLDKVLHNTATSDQRLLLQHLVNGNHLVFTDNDENKFSDAEIAQTVNMVASENSELLQALYVMQA
ncbi:hypothetical protein [Pedobacter immunditicola]|uniref:hypothetical protein n=1 Tax=Pedobacter immunditicola TaxID=3133440 RepID=UPI0030ABF187